MSNKCQNSFAAEPCHDEDLSSNILQIHVMEDGNHSKSLNKKTDDVNSSDTENLVKLFACTNRDEIDHTFEEQLMNEKFSHSKSAANNLCLDEQQQLNHTEMKEVFHKALAQLLTTDPILGDLHPDITHSEVTVLVSSCNSW